MKELKDKIIDLLLNYEDIETREGLFEVLNIDRVDSNIEETLILMEVIIDKVSKVVIHNNKGDFELLNKVHIYIEDEFNPEEEGGEFYFNNLLDEIDLLNVDDFEELIKLVEEELEEQD